MDLNTVAVETRSTPEPEWNEDKLVLSLTRLQEMHAQLRYLRETIPRILDPLLIHQSSPEVLYASFSQTAVGAFKDVKDFSKLIEDSRSRTILERAKESRAESSEGITGWKVTEHKDWLDVRREASPKDSADGLDDGNSQVNGSSEEDLRAALKKFEGNHAGIETSLVTDGSNIMEIYLPSAAHLRLKVEPKYSTQNQTSYVMTLLGKPNSVYTTILEEITKRPTPCDLEYLLEMLASYADFHSSPCIKCGRVLDPEGKFALVRTRIRTKAADNHHTTQWQALHKNCS